MGVSSVIFIFLSTICTKILHVLILPRKLQQGLHQQQKACGWYETVILDNLYEQGCKVNQSIFLVCMNTFRIPPCSPHVFRPAQAATSPTTPRTGPAPSPAMDSTLVRVISFRCGGNDIHVCMATADSAVVLLELDVQWDKAGTH